MIECLQKKKLQKKEICEAVTLEIDGDDLHENSDEGTLLIEILPPSSSVEAKQAIDVVFKYFESDRNTTCEELHVIFKINKSMNDKLLANICQTQSNKFHLETA